MTTAARRMVTRLAAAAAIGAAVLAYSYRDRLTAWPWEERPAVGAVLGGEPRASAPAGGTDMADMPGMGDRDGAAADPDPRAPVSLDLRRQQLIGVRTAPVERAAASTTIRAAGIVRYDETRLTDVNIKVGGWIRELHVDFTGEPVSRGQPLFTLYSPELLATQQEYLLALRTRDQLQQSTIADARARADRLADAARTRLELWDIPDEERQRLEQTREAAPTVTFRSPAAGVVIEKPAVEGMRVEPGQTLYRLADLSRVWVEADVYEREIALVRTGQAATVTLDAYPGERFTGRVAYVYPFAETQTRTVRVRVELANRAGRLKPGMYAGVTLEAPLGMTTTVPADAVIDAGTRQVVFVAEGGGYFQPRDVTVGQRLGERVQILDGLEAGEQVAAGATFFLDSESQLRASVQGFAPPPAAAGGGAPAEERLQITFAPQPDPPRTGDNELRVTVLDAAGQPVDDARVAVTFFMAAMPSMNMPAMRSEAVLEPLGRGRYRGTGQVLMGGRWDVTVSVTRDGQRLGSEQFAMVVR